MRWATYAPEDVTTFEVCILVPKIDKQAILDAYLTPAGINPEHVLVLDLHQAEGKKKTPASEIKAYIEQELAEVLNDCQVKYLIVADADYFKILTKQSQAEKNLGYVLDCHAGPWKAAYVPNFRQIFYDPDRIKAKIFQGIMAVTQHRTGVYQTPGAQIIHHAAYPHDPAEIEAWLEKLLDYPGLTADIEAFSLKHHTAGIGTISFAWNKHEGIAFPVDLGPDPERVRKALKSFFLRYRGKLIWHHIAYDVYVLIYQLFMDHILDTEGLLEGLQVLLGGDWDDTKIITYLATNSCAGNKLGLKDQAQEFSGNYAVDEIEDITKIPLPDLLQYNLIDSLSTWFVFEKHWGTMVTDQQKPVYDDLFKPATWDIIQMQLTGMPVNMKRVKEVEALLNAEELGFYNSIMSSPLVGKYAYKLEEKHVLKRNAELKKKQIKLGDEPQEFNPGSSQQLQDLLYGMLGLPVIALTDTKLPATDADTLKALKHQTTDQQIIDLLTALHDWKKVNKITTSFIPAMLQAAEGPDGWHYLFGNFNLGGTLSGRLSSSKPNLQNLPANSKYAKLIKSCFEAPPGWMFCGLDFDSLEDKISALTTKDPQKLKVYTDGFDGHSLRAAFYFKDRLEAEGIIIDLSDPKSVNTLKDMDHPVRQESKVPTFALTYDGTYVTLMTGSGFDMETAKMIEARYHELYVISDQWVSAKLDEAARTGYVTVAFGLRVRTPLLKQVIRKTSKTPYEAEAEGRSAGNALGQSWCLLNSRAWMATMKKVRASKHRLNIRPCSQIHDAGYALVRDDVTALKYLNDTLVPEVQWQEHPDIKHDEVKLTGKLGVFYPNWTKEITLPVGASEQEIFSTIDAAMV